MSARKAEKAWVVDLIALWVLALGLWPLADPSHEGDSLLSVLDVALHAAAAMVLGSRWKVRVLRRSSPTSTREARGTER